MSFASKSISETAVLRFLMAWAAVQDPYKPLSWETNSTPASGSGASDG
eukprot:CAMPEP_0194722754 /NCGR_PEP_ID=MMETSP0296-20130528/13836_1 /TAXON_ID=39354 /ORGANISM="Heterosigma akashiwo, Strain CCMP2393" /LENGTH=47 /DNA_ID= /DNA_START= /DNA_END= /DNA_ORIENTATION=